MTARIYRVGAWVSATFASLLAAVPLYAQTLGRAADDGLPIGRIVVAFLVCIAIAFAAAVLLRARMGGGLSLASLRNAERRLRIVETLRVSPQHMVVLVDMDGAEMILAVSPTQLAIIPHKPVNDLAGTAE